MPRLTIDNIEVACAEGTTILEAATRSNIAIPSLCYHKNLSISGSCRLCMVEIDGIENEVASCTCEAVDGMVVATETPRLIESRRMILEMLLSRYVGSPDATDEEDEFLRLVKRYQLKPFEENQRRYVADSDPNPFIRVDLDQCILCTRCVRACAEIQGRFVWGVGHRGGETKIVAGLDTTMMDARCESCGACVAYCPTGALTDRMFVEQQRPTRLVRTTCGYCGVGCQFDLNVADDKVIGVTSTPSAPVNGMSLCVKGRYGSDYVHHPERLTQPMVRRYLLDGSSRERTDRPVANRGDWVNVDWDAALQLVAQRLSAIKRESGPDAVGLLSSAKCTNEENYLMQKFARQVIGTHNIDHCARLCHSSTVAGLTMAVGSGAMSNTMRDIANESKAIFIIGSNTTEQHPVFGAMLRQAVLRRGIPIVVADPRRVDITEFAQLHLQHRPGTDVALLNGMMHIVLEHHWHDQEFVNQRCEGFEAFRDTIASYDPERVARITGVSVECLQRASEILACNRPMAVIWAMGITQHTTGVMNVLSLANLQMLLGNLGVAGGGVNPLRGQNNVQGACDLGTLPNVYPGYQPIHSDDVVRKFTQAWQVVAPQPNTWHLPDSRAGLTVTEMISAAGTGDVRALYILGEDPVTTEPDCDHVRKSLVNAELTILQEIFPSETAEYADVLLPGASFAEKEGTFTNTERRIQPIRPAITPRGNARPDWQIISELARRMVAIDRLELQGPHAGWSYAGASEIMDEIANLVPLYAGVSHQRLEHDEQLHWPVPNADHPGTPILHVDQFTRGRGRFHTVDHLPPQELPDTTYPLLLTTGRVIYHWHGGELSRRSRGLLEAYPQTIVEVSIEDADRYGIQDGTPVRLTSRRGEMVAHAAVTDRVASGVVFGNFHFPGPENVNNLTIAALDPTAKIPEYKVCAVRIEATTGAGS